MSIIEDIKEFVGEAYQEISTSSQSVLKSNNMGSINEKSSKYRGSKSVSAAIDDYKDDLHNQIHYCKDKAKSLTVKGEGEVDTDALVSSIEEADGDLDDLMSAVEELNDLKNSWEERSRYIEEQFDNLVTKFESKLNDLSGYLEDLQHTIKSSQGQSIDQITRDIVCDIRLQATLKTRESTFKR